jgi:O-antigen ligase
MRTTLGLTRLGMYYILLCFLVLQAGLMGRALRESGWRLNTSLHGTETSTNTPRLGVTVQMEHLSPAERQAALERLAENGVDWVRQRVDWGTVEMTPGEFDWSWIDGWLLAVHDAGLDPVVFLDGSPAWARAARDVAGAGNPLAPPADPATFARFAAQFAERYGGAIRVYQIWDEPNIAPHWGNQHIDPVGYAQLLAAASAAIRAEDSDALILTAALAPTADRGHLAMDEVYFLQRMIAAGAGPAFDALAIEPFGFGASALNPRQAIPILNFQRAALLRGALVAAGLGEKAVWAVRIGWNVRGDSPWATVTAEHQRSYACTAVDFAQRQWPWLAAIGWSIDQPDAPLGDPVWGFALDDSLLRSFTQQIACTLPTTIGDPPHNIYLTAGLLLVLAIVSLWRANAARCALPWRAWRSSFVRLPVANWLGVWIGLLVIYYFATWPPLIMLCWLVGSLLALWQPHVALWIAALSLPFYFQHKELHLVDGAVTVSPMVASTLILIPALLVRLRREFRHTAGWGFRWQPTDSLQSHAAARLQFTVRHLPFTIFLLLVWPLISLLSLPNVWHAPAYWRGLIELVIAPVLLALAILLLPKTTEQRRGVAIALFAGGVLTAIIGLTNWLRGQGVEVDGVLRLVAVQYSPNHSALYLLRTLFLGIGLAIAMHGRLRWGVMVFVAVVACALLLTASRGALFLGIPAGVCVLVGLWLANARISKGDTVQRLFARRPLQISLACFVALTVIAIAVLVVGEGRLLNLESVDSRLLVWQAAWQLWRHNPLLGVGPDGFFWSYPAYLAPGGMAESTLLHPHNVWLEIGAGWGVLGLAWLLGIVIGWLWGALRMMRRGWREDRWLIAGLTAALIAGLAHAQVDAFLALPDLAGWLLVALAVCVGEFSEKENQLSET